MIKYEQNSQNTRFFFQESLLGVIPNHHIAEFVTTSIYESWKTLTFSSISVIPYQTTK